MPRASASREARSTISSGISSCIITASTGSRNMAGTSSGRMLRFAPGKTMMLFSPPACTRMGAYPVGASCAVRSRRSSTPSSVRVLRRAWP